MRMPGYTAEDALFRYKGNRMGIAEEKSEIGVVPSFSHVCNGPGGAWTDTKCILFTMWCQNKCRYYEPNPKTGELYKVESGYWYPCGICGNPFGGW